MGKYMTQDSIDLVKKLRAEGLTQSEIVDATDLTPGMVRNRCAVFELPNESSSRSAKRSHTKFPARKGAPNLSFDECVQKTGHDLITPEIGNMRGEPVELEPNSCWKWVTPHKPAKSIGYPTFGSGKNQVYAYRYALERHTNYSPHEGDIACHKCNNYFCVNPEHLYWGTNKENHADMMFARRLKRAKEA